MPHKQPSTLFQICIKNSLELINETCSNIERKYPRCEYHEGPRHVCAVKGYLISTLPTRLFDVLCLSRKSYPYSGNPELQLHILTHPQMTVFRKYDTDNAIPLSFWMHVIPMLTRLVVLDLKFVCTDEILKTIATECLLLEELNIVSKVDVRKSPINASVLVRNVSDAGLCCVANFKLLRILAMDPPRNEKSNRVGRCVSQAGIMMLIRELPRLEELRIESCDVGSTLTNSNLEIGPLNIRKVNCHYTSAESVQKLVRICPNLRELSITHLSTHDKDAILEEISSSDLKLNKLDISFFSYSPSLQRLLKVQGPYLTHFSFWEVEDSVTVETILDLGTLCPNLLCLCILTQSMRLHPPHNIRRLEIFTKLKTLTLGCENFNIEDVLIFFLACAQNLQQLTVKYQSKINIDETIKQILFKGYFRSIQSLWLDCTLEVSKDVIKQVIEKCPNLVSFTVDCNEDMRDVHKYICDNNLDLRLGGY